MNEIIVADAGPLIALGRTNNIFILNKLFKSIIIPDSVASECLADKTRPGALAIQKSIENTDIKVHFNNSSILKNNTLGEILDKGEAAAIELAYSSKVPLLIDEKLGRQVAQKLQIKIIGTAGILILAKQNNIIPAVEPILHNLKEGGYFFSKNLMDAVLKRVGE